MEHTSPHDSFVKGILKYPDVAREFFQSLLPAEVSGAIEWETLEAQPGTFISAELRNSYSDMLFSCRLRNEPAFVYFLLEHQTTIERMMPLRVATYCVHVLNDWLKNNAGAQALPVVVPVVFHQSARTWNAPSRLIDLLAVPDSIKERFAPWILNAGFILIDLRELNLADLQGGLLLRLMLELLKTVVEGTQVQWLERHGRDLVEISRQHDGHTILRMILHYIWFTKTRQAAGKTASTLKQIADMFQHAELRNEIMTIGEALIEEGRQEGRENGWRGGTLAGQIQFCEALLGQTVRTRENLELLSLSNLEAELARLEKEVKSRWNKG
jgi:predicted transposase/invertase (TIGR01784 family)